MGNRSTFTVGGVSYRLFRIVPHHCGTSCAERANFLCYLFGVLLPVFCLSGSVSTRDKEFRASTIHAVKYRQSFSARPATLLGFVLGFCASRRRYSVAGIVGVFVPDRLHSCVACITTTTDRNR